MRHFFVTLQTALLLAFSQSVAQTNSLNSLRLVPFPKEVRASSAGLKMIGEMTIQVDDVVPAKQVEIELQAELARRVQGAATLRSTAPGDNSFFSLRLSKRHVSDRTLRQALGSLPEQPEGYVLVITDAFAAIGARQPAGLAHGIQTLRQLVRANLRGGRLPGVFIRDWPSLRYRGFSDDITRGPSPTLATLQREVELAGLLRMNFFTYYMENQYAFAKHPLIGPKDGSLKPEELKSLVRYATERGIEVIGNQQSFGHFANILQHEQYADLRETPNVLNPTNDKTYQLLDDLYSEQAPLLASKFFNVCCDETEGLGTGPSKALAEQIGVGGVYTRHLRRIHDLLKDHCGKRMMMWGDIILNHPKNLADIPKDTILLSWGYDGRDSFDSQITPFARSGYEFFVCPGVSCWSRVLPDFQVSVKNISNFVRDGAKQNALGMLNTTWDDDGENLAGPNWYGIAWGAECAWNASATPVEAFNRRVGAVLFGEDGAAFGEAVELLGTAHRLSAFEEMSDNAFWKTEFAHWLKDEQKAADQAEVLQNKVRAAIAKLKLTKESARVDADVLDTFLFGAQRMELMAIRVTEGRPAVAAYRQAVAASDPATAAALIEKGCAARVRRMRDAFARLKDRYVELWNRENRPYALDAVTRRYDAAIAYYDGILKRLASAAEDLKARRPLPPAERLGLSGTEGR